MDYEAKKVFLVNLAVSVVWLGLAYLAARLIIGYLLPFVIGAVMAIVVKKPASRLARKFKTGVGGWSVVLVLLLYAAVVTAAGFLVWQLAVQSAQLAEGLPRYISSFTDFLSGALSEFEKMENALPDGIRQTAMGALENTVSNLISSLTSFITEGVVGLVRGIPSVFFSAVITVVASCYIAVDFEHLIRFIRELLRPRTYDNLIKIKGIFCNNIFKYVLGYVILTVIAFAELLVGFWLLDVKYPLLIAAITAVIDLLPVFGTGTVLLPWSVFSFASGNGGLGFGLILLYGVIVMVRYFTEPKIIGKNVGINPLVSLIAMVLGLKLGGIWGLLLFPISVIVIVHYYKRQLDEEREGLQN